MENRYSKYFITLLLLVNLVGCSQYPTEKDINSLVESVSKESSLDVKVSQLSAFLRSVSNPSSAEEDKVLNKTLDQYELLFYSGNSDAVLLSVINQNFDGAFANYLCVFLAGLYQSSEFVRFSQEHDVRKLIDSCQGLTL